MYTKKKLSHFEFKKYFGKRYFFFEPRNFSVREDFYFIQKN